MDKRILKFVAQNLKSNYTDPGGDYAKYKLVGFAIAANDEMLDLLFELGYVKTIKFNAYKFTKKALDILNEE